MNAISLDNAIKNWQNSPSFCKVFKLIKEITLRATLFSLLISNTVNVLENSEQHIVYLTFCVSKHSFLIKKLTGTSHLPSDQLKKLKDLRKATAVHSVAKIKQVWQPFL